MTIKHDLIVEPKARAFGSGLRVAHDVILRHDAELVIGGGTIGHDILAAQAAAVRLERTTIAHDLRCDPGHQLLPPENGPAGAEGIGGGK